MIIVDVATYWHIGSRMKPHHCVLLFCTLNLSAFMIPSLCAQEKHTAFEPIRNPYYPTRAWKLWREDSQPVTVRVPRVDDESKEATWSSISLHLPAEDKRLYPQPLSKDYPIIHYGKRFDSSFAGIWDDVHLNQDKGHAKPRDCWSADNRLRVNRLRSAMILGQDVDYGWGPRFPQYGAILRAMGVTFANQSTTGLAHELANDPAGMAYLEREYYFANIFFAAPAHYSYNDTDERWSRDCYQALTPIYYNSMGSSSSETEAVAKIALAGGYLSPSIKLKLKRHGAYAATMLYLWKSCLPFDVPYDHELRHRIAYSSNGNPELRRGMNNIDLARGYHFYDERAHMKCLVKTAQAMRAPPPVAAFNLLEHTGCHLVYAKRCVMLVQQGSLVLNSKNEPERRDFPCEDVVLRIDTAPCYDLDDREIHVRWAILYGHDDVQIDQEGKTSIYRIRVPYRTDLPQGRTAIALIANNGIYDSNPAIINIYRTDGMPNRRVVFHPIAPLTLHPEETFRIPLRAYDPEGQSVSFALQSTPIARIDGNAIVGRIPISQPIGQLTLQVIASDRTAGNGYATQPVSLNINKVRAVLGTDKTAGPVPLAIRFSSRFSHVVLEDKFSVKWNFGDGTFSEKPEPEHVFTQPGFYKVSLSVHTSNANHTCERWIHARHRWGIALDNGWHDGQIDPKIWRPRVSSNQPLKIINQDGRFCVEIKTTKKQCGVFGLDSVASFCPPLYVEAVYQRTLDWSRSITGFHLLDANLGCIGKGYRSDWRTIKIGRITGTTPSGWDQLALSRKMRFPWADTLLRLYISDDPIHPGRIRYAGELTTGLDCTYFCYDNQPPIENSQFGIWSGGGGSTFRISRFQVWSPSGALSRPALVVEGNDKPLLTNGCAHHYWYTGTDFGAPTEQTSRVFTLRNRGNVSLILSGEPCRIVGPDADAFQILQQPTSVISAQEKSTLRLSFYPKHIREHKAFLCVYPKSGNIMRLPLVGYRESVTASRRNLQ